jgi:hypothetical protein
LHEANETEVPGISVDGHDALVTTDPVYAAWWKAMHPALRYCVRLEALDESLRRWRCYRAPIFAPPHAYLISIVHTPPGSPAWLEALTPWRDLVRP